MEQSPNEKGHFASLGNSIDKSMDLDSSIVQDDDFDCYKTSQGKLFHSNTKDELQVLPKETNHTTESGTNYGQSPSELSEFIGKKVKDATICETDQKN